MNIAIDMREASKMSSLGKGVLGWRIICYWPQQSRRLFFLHQLQKKKSRKVSISSVAPGYLLLFIILSLSVNCFETLFATWKILSLLMSFNYGITPTSCDMTPSRGRSIQDYKKEGNNTWLSFNVSLSHPNESVVTRRCTVFIYTGGKTIS